MLKSEPPPNLPTGNVKKFLSYREAWTRIKQSQAAGFYLEAIALIESIIGDRLTSVLVKSGQIQRKSEIRKYPGFSDLIKAWSAVCPQPIQQGSYENLQEAVDQWRLNRNRLIHGMVRSHPGGPTVDVVDFITDAKLTAQQGETLARAVCSWSSRWLKQLKQLKQLNKQPTQPMPPATQPQGKAKKKRK
jgi:hypothetical protein